MSIKEKTLKPFNLYGQDIEFIVNKGGNLETNEEIKEFLNDNFDLIGLIYNYEDDLIKVGKGAGLHDGKDINTMIKKLYGRAKREIRQEDGCGFDNEKFDKKNFYEMPIIEFKKLFD